MRHILRMTAFGAWLAVTPALAQTPAPAGVEPSASEPAVTRRLDAASLSRQLEESDALLRAVREQLPEPEDYLEIASNLAGLEEQVEEAERATRRRLDSPGSSIELRDVGAEWARLKDRISRQQADVQDYLAPLQRSADEIDAQQVRWKSTLDALDASFPAELKGRATTTVKALATAESDVLERTAQAIALSVRLSTLQDTADTLSTTVERTVREQLWSRDAPSLWALVASDEAPAPLREVAAASAEHRAVGLGAYLASDAVRLWAHLFLTLLIGVGTMRLSRMPAEHQPPGESLRWRVILTRPLSAGLVMSLGLGGWLHANAPSAFWTCVFVVALVPFGRVLTSLVSSSASRGILGLFALYFLDRFGALLMGQTLTYRIVLLTVAGAGLLGAIVAARRLAPQRLPVGERSGTALRPLFQSAAALFGVAMLAGAVGMVSLAALIVQATLESLLLLVVLGLTERLLEGVLQLALHLPAVRALRMVERHADAIAHRGRRLLTFATALLWVAGTLFLFGMLDPVVRVLGDVLGAKASAGTLTFSLGAVLAFGLVISGTLWLSRMVGFVLDEDVLPRMALPRGVPVTISKTAQYAALAVGFLIAFAAAGVEVTQFAFLAGALGVGIGFGLQTIVNNFVSGLILLYERPIKEGDVIEVGTLLGTIQHIGIRACRVRTLDGAEVIVPNASLVSDNVINWTLTDRLRRLDLPIGVAYGSDLTAVQVLLRECMDDLPGLLTQPAPVVFFMGFGDSSLDFRLRGWTQFDDQFQVRSELGIRVNERLAAAGVAIPFPQRDLHLRSIDADAAEALRAPPAPHPEVRPPEPEPS